MGLIFKKRKLAQDTSGISPTIIIVGIVAAVSLVGTYLIAKPVGEGIGEAFTIFGQEIGLYATIGVTLLGLMFLWLVFGRK